MYIYVIAASESGPSKIGIAADPKKRLSALQTGNATQLSLYRCELVIHSASAAERAAHRALDSKRLRSDGEWFDVSPSKAHAVVLAVAASMNALVDEGASLQKLSIRSAQSWIDELERYRETTSVSYEECDALEDLHPPNILQLVAGTTKSPKSRFSFNDYLLTWDDGMWIRWAFEQMARRMPRGNLLKPYLEADRFLEQQGTKHGRNVAARWIEWSAGRELSNEEVRTLIQIWNQFAPLHNRIERKGPQWATAGIDDHVDDVHLFALCGDEARGDRTYPVFEHDAFRIVLVPDRHIELISAKSFLCPDIFQIQNAGMSGFVAPVIRSDTWSQPFRPWLRNAPKRRDAALAHFLGNLEKRFPTPRKYDGPQPATDVFRFLSCIDKYGFF